jgi:hypothetical protein
MEALEEPSGGALALNFCPLSHHRELNEAIQTTCEPKNTAKTSRCAAGFLSVSSYVFLYLKIVVASRAGPFLWTSQKTAALARV